MAKRLLEGSHVGCETFANGHDFLEAWDGARPGCVVLEQRIPDMSGFQLLRRLAAGGRRLPLVFVLGHATVATAVEMMRCGAVHVLEKPLRSLELLNAIHEAVELDQRGRVRDEHVNELRERVSTLSRKEREVLDLLGQARSVKSIAAELGLSIRAIEQRRRSLMNKLAIETPVELLRFTVALKQAIDLVPAVTASNGRGRDVTRLASASSCAIAMPNCRAN
jgi:FixJ family two-component response regulator